MNSLKLPETDIQILKAQAAEWKRQKEEQWRREQYIAILMAHQGTKH